MLSASAAARHAAASAPAAACQPQRPALKALCPSLPGPGLQRGAAGRRAAAPAPRQRQALLPRASGGSGSDLESEILGQGSFQNLAKAVASRLAKEAAAGTGVGWGRLGMLLQPPTSEAGKEGGQEGGEGAGKKGGGGGVLGKAASIAASVLGVGDALKSGRQDDSPAAAAARYLGADSLNLSVDSVKNWLTSPQRKGDVKMVAALVWRMLQYLERDTGERFSGEDRQYKLLARLASEVFGGSMTSRVVRALVEAYLRVPGSGL